MNENRAEAFIMAIENDIARFLNARGQLSASKISGLLYLSIMDSYAIKANVEESLKEMAMDPEYGGSPEKPLSFPELAESRKKVLSAFGKNEVGVKSDA